MCSKGDSDKKTQNFFDQKTIFYTTLGGMHVFYDFL